MSCPALPGGSGHPGKSRAVQMLMSRISKWIVPAGTSTSTRSPFLRPSSAFAIGVPIASLPSRRSPRARRRSCRSSASGCCGSEASPCSKSALCSCRSSTRRSRGRWPSYPPVWRYASPATPVPHGRHRTPHSPKGRPCRRFGDRRRNRRTLDGTHVLEFVLDFLVALRCQINNLLCHNPITLRNLPPEAGNSKNRIKRKK